MHNLLVSQLPVEKWVTNGVDWLTQHLSGFFNVIQNGGNTLMSAMTDGLIAIPMFLMIAGIFLIAVVTSPKKWGFPIFALAGLLLIANQELWSDLMSTMTLVIMSALMYHLGLVWQNLIAHKPLYNQFWTLCKPCLVLFT